jgi:hypothetical protein
MKWDQIETKWALMTRRIRADIGDERHDAVKADGKSADGLTRREKAIIARNQILALQDPEFKTAAK